MEKTKLTPIRLPVELLNDLDAHIGEGQRSKFIVEATKKELVRLKQLKALKSAQGVFKAEDYAEFNTTEGTSLWVRKLREESETRRREIFGEK